MADYTSRLGLIKQDYRENPESWGTELNNAMIELADDVHAVEEITVDGNVTLSWDDGIENQARRQFLPLVGAGGFTVTVKAIDRAYIVHNRCAADVTIMPENGSGAVVRAGTLVVWYTDGAVSRVADTTLDKIAKPTAPLDLDNQKIINVADGEYPTDAPNLGQLSQYTERAESAAQAAEESAEAAADSESQTLVYFSDFVNRWLLPASSDPIEDELGNPLGPGAAYLNTTAGRLRVYDGIGWQAIEAVTFATKGQAETGTNNATVMTPLRVAESFDVRKQRVLISEINITTAVAAVEFATLPPDFDEFVIEAFGVTPSTNAELLVQLAASGSWRTSNYISNAVAGSSGGTSYGRFSDGAIQLTNASLVGWGGGIRADAAISIKAPHSTIYPTSCVGHMRWGNPGGNTAGGSVCAVYATAEAHSGVRLLPSAGNLTAGRFRLLGIKL